MTDARFSGGSVGLVIGHVAPEALLGGPIALVEDGDTVVVDLNTDSLDCASSATPASSSGGRRPGGRPPRPTAASTRRRAGTDRVLARMRATALPALLGEGMATPPQS